MDYYTFAADIVVLYWTLYRPSSSVRQSTCCCRSSRAWSTRRCHRAVSQKHAIVIPLLKRPGLDATDMANLRPVSNLTFMSKVIERAMARQLNGHLSAEDLLPRNQSAYRKQHSAETALIRVLTDNEWRCSGCSTCQQRSTVSTTHYYCRGWNISMVWPV